MYATTGFFARTRNRLWYSSSEPAADPPGDWMSSSSARYLLLAATSANSRE